MEKSNLPARGNQSANRSNLRVIWLIADHKRKSMNEIEKDLMHFPSESLDLSSDGFYDVDKNYTSSWLRSHQIAQDKERDNHNHHQIKEIQTEIKRLPQGFREHVANP